MWSRRKLRVTLPLVDGKRCLPRVSTLILQNLLRKERMLREGVKEWERRRAEKDG